MAQPVLLNHLCEVSFEFFLTDYLGKLHAAKITKEVNCEWSVMKSQWSIVNGENIEGIKKPR